MVDADADPAGVVGDTRHFGIPNVPPSSTGFWPFRPSASIGGW
jgi:hypothetical protein